MRGTVTRIVRRLALPGALTMSCLLLAAPAHGAYPGENGKIAFTRGTSVQGDDIHTIDPDGSGLQQVTSTGAERDPVWSPNGRRIAFSSERDGNPEIYVMNAQGGDQTRLTNDPAEDTNPTWSPDGTKIAFERFVPGSGFDIYVMNADGTGSRAVSGMSSVMLADPVPSAFIT